MTQTAGKPAPPTAATGRALVIVESPTKAGTIGKYLGPGFAVQASVGHIRDLVERKSDLQAGDAARDEKWVNYGVNIANGFEPLQELYVVPKDKLSQVAALKKALQGVDTLYLATDDDREGEAISWHLQQVLNPKVKTKRLVFHEITKEAIQAALKAPRELDMRLVDAQRTRRVVDRLYGWDVSQLLWRKIKGGLSAGRVQSVALRLLVERERERMAFVSADWASVHGLFGAAPQRPTFDATLTQIGGQRVASGKDFDPTTGKLTKGVQHLNLAAAQALCARLAGQKATVHSVETKPQTLRPAPPFTTSTLQQEANRKLRFSAKQTMQVAQRLYESGYITYMRTDSVTLSAEAIGAARGLIEQQYGPAYLPAQPRLYKTKQANAQEAHEAIRPAGRQFAAMAEVASAVGNAEARLYELIWKRTVASQMADAQVEQTTADIAVDEAMLRATGRVTRFAGYLMAYVEGNDDPEQDLQDRDTVLPPLHTGQVLVWGEPPLRAAGHTTQPPPRLNDASLVKALEDKGIGRPSTYAAILQNLLDKGYSFRKGQALVPTFMAMAVIRMLETHMPHLVDYAFTAKMEGRLDRIATGDDSVSAYLRGFYADGFVQDGQPIQGLTTLLVAVKDNIDPKVASAVAIGTTDDGEAVVVRIGKFGTFVTVGDTKKANVPAEQEPDQLSVAAALALVAQKAKADEAFGQDPVSGKPLYLRNGRFGWFLQLGANPANGSAASASADDRKNASLSKGMDPQLITVELALRQLGLPKTLGKDAAGVPVTAHVGRYGDYVQRGEDRRNLPADLWAIDADLATALRLVDQPRNAGNRELVRELGTHEDKAIGLWRGRFGVYVTDGNRSTTLKATVDLQTMTLPQALELLAAGELARTGKVVGTDPDSGQPVRLIDGRFGPYLTNGAVNASLARGTTADEVNLELALDRLRHFGKPAKSGKGRRKTRSSPASKATPAKTAAAKTPSAKPAAAKPAKAASAKVAKAKATEAAARARANVVGVATYRAPSAKSGPTPEPVAPAAATVAPPVVRRRGAVPPSSGQSSS